MLKNALLGVGRCMLYMDGGCVLIRFDAHRTYACAVTSDI